MRTKWYFFTMFFFIGNQLIAQTNLNNQQVDGYKGIWFTLGQFSEYGDKYSGGLGTYTAKHRPVAIYSDKANKTFFVYGGTTSARERHLLCMISYYDHHTGMVPKPTVVCDKAGIDDPHDNPSLAIDRDGFIWVFVSGRGRHRSGFKYKSRQSYDITSFVRVTEEEMTYPQPLWDDEKGFFNFFTKYTGVRELYFETSDDGRQWSPDIGLAGIIEDGAEKSGHYQVSGKDGDLICTFFNRHPNGRVDKRTDLYYAQTLDFGKTWTTIAGKNLDLPMKTVNCGARLIDYASQAKNVYLKDLNFDDAGNPVCLYVTSGGHEPGPGNAPREWRVTHFDGKGWQTSVICESDHNYDMGSLYIKGKTWTIIAPTISGPQEYQTGGEVAVWESGDEGKTWKRKKQVTKNSPQNHTYVRRPVNAENPFYALWADGNPIECSKSFLYFTDAKGKRIFQLPYEMTADFAKPKQIKYP
ncbi:MAG: BNR repeat-containing protein [Cytophagales bacterium]|nr:BNR repeat-containing protein [Cytophagales bacterium]